MKKRSFIAVWLLALVAIACALLVYENDLLWKVQEMNLFLNTSLYFKQQMVVSGGLLTYLGTFFTQFLHYPGGTALCVVVAVDGFGEAHLPGARQVGGADAHSRRPPAADHR